MRLVTVAILDFASFIYFAPFVPPIKLICENVLRKDPAAAELQPLKHLLPGGTISEIDFNF